MSYNVSISNFSPKHSSTSVNNRSACPVNTFAHRKCVYRYAFSGLALRINCACSLRSSSRICACAINASKSVARYQTDIMGTRETQSVLLMGVCAIKPIDGKIVQMTLWESDPLIVLVKRVIPMEERAGGRTVGTGTHPPHQVAG